jgi:hypothetical protein
MEIEEKKHPIKIKIRKLANFGLRTSNTNNDVDLDHVPIASLRPTEGLYANTAPSSLIGRNIGPGARLVKFSKLCLSKTEGSLYSHLYGRDVPDLEDFPSISTSSTSRGNLFLINEFDERERVDGIITTPPTADLPTPREITSPDPYTIRRYDQPYSNSAPIFKSTRSYDSGESVKSHDITRVISSNQRMPGKNAKSDIYGRSILFVNPPLTFVPPVFRAIVDYLFSNTDERRDLQRKTYIWSDCFMDLFEYLPAHFLVLRPGVDIILHCGRERSLDTFLESSASARGFTTRCIHLPQTRTAADKREEKDDADVLHKDMVRKMNTTDIIFIHWDFDRVLNILSELDLVEADGYNINRYFISLPPLNDSYLETDPPRSVDSSLSPDLGESPVELRTCFDEPVTPPLHQPTGPSSARRKKAKKRLINIKLPIGAIREDSRSTPSPPQTGKRTFGSGSWTQRGGPL